MKTDKLKEFESLMASFVYGCKVKAKCDLTPAVSQNHAPFSFDPHRNGGDFLSEIGGDGDLQESLLRPPLEPSTRKRRMRSSCVRAEIEGKTVVVSRFFPLPDGAVVMDGDDVRASAKRKRHKRKSPQLSSCEKKSDCYRRIVTESMWVPPRSCYNLFQENHFFDPWRVLVICMLLNVTTGRQVGRVLQDLFDKWPNAEALATEASIDDLEKLMQVLGLQTKRAWMLKRFSQEYLEPNWTHVTELHGVGKYAADAYAIFCVGKPEDVFPQDHKLICYWKFVCGKQLENCLRKNQENYLQISKE